MVKFGLIFLWFMGPSPGCLSDYLFKEALLQTIEKIPQNDSVTLPLDGLTPQFILASCEFSFRGHSGSNDKIFDILEFRSMITM